MTLDWHPERLREKLERELLTNGELVGKFVEKDAQRRLLGYGELDVQLGQRERYVGGGAYRKYVAGLMGSEVEKDRNGIIIRVGVKTGRGGSHHGLYIELGSRVSPARPFLRPAVFENADKIVQLLSGR